jgi:hypothetical protein
MLRPLLDCLSRQTVRAKAVCIVGSRPDDIGNVTEAEFRDLKLSILYAERAGLCLQRNRGIQFIRNEVAACEPNGRFAILFFDDDFRPERRWIDLAIERLKYNDIVGLTGEVINDDGIVESQVVELLATYRRGAVKEFAIRSCFGCNMIFMDYCFRNLSFDAALPEYGWLEDLHFSRQCIRTFGSLIHFSSCYGVHLGNMNSGRNRGIKMGYSQIANPIYMYTRGTLSVSEMLYFVGRALGSNVLRSLRVNTPYDYRGRCRGNVIAFWDMLRGRMSPMRIRDLSVGHG